MNNISCDICMDLMPLVQDGVASQDSVSAVEEHMASCPVCRALYQAPPPASGSDDAVTAKIKHKFRTFFALLTFIGMFFGISLLENQDVLYILFVMPIIGACSYPVYRWKALWKDPLVLSGLYLIAHMISLLQGAAFSLLGIVLWMLMITVFTDVGVLIVGLLHFAFRKEKSK